MVSFADKPLLEVGSPEEWERWIVEVGDSDGVRLKLRKRLSKLDVGITYDEALDVALCHGWIDGQVARFDDDFVLQAFTPRRRASPWSQRNVAHGERLIAAGLMREGGLAEIDRAKADGRWDAAYRVSGATAPEDLQAALDADPAVKARFEAMPSQARFLAIIGITGVKRAETRARKIAELIARLQTPGSD